MDVPRVELPGSEESSVAETSASKLTLASIQPAEIHGQLERILVSKGFRNSVRLQRFLKLAVERTLAGQTEQLKEYAVGRDVFDRGADYDPRVDSIVRVEARRLRKKLREYYGTAGAAEAVLIHFPPGTYAPQFTRGSQPPAPLANQLPRESEKASERAAVAAFSNIRPDPCTVAVLPFSNLSPEAEQQYFCDGITEDIINALTPIAQLQIIGRTSMFAVESSSRDLREIGARLGAGTIVEGSVRKAGEMLRVSAKIIDSETRQTKWSQVFDRQTQDVFAIEDEIAHSIAGVLRITLQAVEPRQTLSKPPSTEAHALYLKGRQAWNLMTRGGFLSAIELFSRAISLYPDYAPPHAGLAFAYLWLSLWGGMRIEEAFPKCKDAALNALRLDPGMASAHASLGLSLFFFEKNYQEGLVLLKKAILLEPSYSFAHQLYGTCLMITGESKEAIAPLERAVHLDPLSFRTNRALGSGYFYLGRLKEAEHSINIAIALRPDSAESHFLLARVYLQQGHLDKALIEARECHREDAGPVILSILGVVLARMGNTGGATAILERLEQMSSAGCGDPIAGAYIQTALGNYSAALELVRKGQKEGSPFAVYANVDPLFEALRSHPDFRRL